MGVKSLWDDEERTLYRVEVHDEWTWDDFDRAIRAAYDMLEALKRDVDFLIGFYTSLPPGSALPHLTAAGVQPENIRHTVILNATGLGTTLFISSLVEAVDNVREWQGPKFVSSLEEAREYLKSLKDN